MCRDYIERYIPEAKNADVRVFEDEGYSGKNTKRPEFQKMMKEVKPVSYTHLDVYKRQIKRRQELSEIIGKMDTEKRQIEQELKLYLGEAEIAENEQYRVSWKAVHSNRLDEKRLKEEEPEIYEKYKKSVLSRRFTVKAA